MSRTSGSGCSPLPAGEISRAAPSSGNVDPLFSTHAFALFLSAILGEEVKPSAASEIKLRGHTIAARALVRLLRMPRQEREALIAAHLR